MSVHALEAQRLSRFSWIQTYMGRRFYPLDPRPQDVAIEDIAHALSMKCRYTGHTARFYSVAEHCERASYLVPPQYALAALLHDASEAYLPDLAAPVKRSFFINRGTSFESFSRLEQRVLDAVFEGLGLSGFQRDLAESEEVKRADLQMLAWEVRDVMGPTAGDWGLTEEPPYDVWTELVPESQQDAEYLFLRRFKELTR